MLAQRTTEDEEQTMPEDMNRYDESGHYTVEQLRSFLQIVPDTQHITVTVQNPESAEQDEYPVTGVMYDPTSNSPLTLFATGPDTPPRTPPQR